MERLRLLGIRIFSNPRQLCTRKVLRLASFRELSINLMALPGLAPIKSPMSRTPTTFWSTMRRTTFSMIGRFLHQDLKCEKGVWNHKCYLRCDKKIAPVLFHSCVVQYRGYPVEYFVICCDLLSSVRLQLTAVIQLVLWMLAKLDKISETPVFSRLSDLAPIIT